MQHLKPSVLKPVHVSQRACAHTCSTHRVLARSELKAKFRGEGGGVRKSAAKRSEDRMRTLKSQLMELKKDGNAKSSNPVDVLHKKVSDFYAAMQTNARQALMSMLLRLTPLECDDITTYSTNEYQYRMSKMAKVIFKEIAQVKKLEKDASDAIDAAEACFSCGAPDFVWAGGCPDCQDWGVLPDPQDVLTVRMFLEGSKLSGSCASGSCRSGMCKNTRFLRFLCIRMWKNTVFLRFLSVRTR